MKNLFGNRDTSTRMFYWQMKFKWNTLILRRCKVGWGHKKVLTPIYNYDEEDVTTFPSGFCKSTELLFQPSFASTSPDYEIPWTLMWNTRATYPKEILICYSRIKELKKRKYSSFSLCVVESGKKWMEKTGWVNWCR